MLDHVGLRVRDFDAARDFYTRTLAPLGLRVVMEVTRDQTGGAAHAGFGTPERPFFWIGDAPGDDAGGAAAHVAFAVATRAEVDAFHRAGLEAGGRDNGPPGLRPHYHPDYYGAFLFDLDGNNIEAVCHGPA